MTQKNPKYSLVRTELEMCCEGNQQRAVLTVKEPLSTAKTTYTKPLLSSHYEEESGLSVKNVKVQLTSSKTANVTQRN